MVTGAPRGSRRGIVRVGARLRRRPRAVVVGPDTPVHSSSGRHGRRSPEPADLMSPDATPHPSDADRQIGVSPPLDPADDRVSRWIPRSPAAASPPPAVDEADAHRPGSPLPTPADPVAADPVAPDLVAADPVAPDPVAADPAPEASEAGPRTPEDPGPGGPQPARPAPGDPSPAGAPAPSSSPGRMARLTATVRRRPDPLKAAAAAALAVGLVVGWVTGSPV